MKLTLEIHQLITNRGNFENLIAEKERSKVVVCVYTIVECIN